MKRGSRIDPPSLHSDKHSSVIVQIYKTFASRPSRACSMRNERPRVHQSAQKYAIIRCPVSPPGIIHRRSRVRKWRAQLTRVYMHAISHDNLSGKGRRRGGGVTIALEPIKVTPRNVSNFLPRSSSFFPSFRRVFGKIALTVPPEIYDFRFAFITPPLPLPLSWRETFLSRGGGAPRFRNEKKYFSSPNSNFSSGIFATMIEIMAGKRKGMEMMENGKEWILRVERFE